MKRTDKVITRLRVGKTNLPGELGQYVKTMDRNCPICQPETSLDSDHILFNCPALADDRNKLRTYVTELGVPFSRENMFNPPKSLQVTVFRHIINFLKDTGFYNKI